MDLEELLIKVIKVTSPRACTLEKCCLSLIKLMLVIKYNDFPPLFCFVQNDLNAMPFLSLCMLDQPSLVCTLGCSN